MDLADKILELLKENPGQTAWELARQLGVERKTVNSLLYSRLRSYVIQDNEYRWWPKEKIETKTEVHRPRNTEEKTFLSKLCGYYLDCLNQDDQSGVSVYASSKFGDLNYVELPEIPIISGNNDSIFDMYEDVGKLWNKVRGQRQLTFMLGYPVYLKKIRYRNGGEGFVIEPIFLFTFTEDSLNNRSKPILSNDPPHLNFKAVKSLLGGNQSNSTIEELVNLSEDLGLNVESKEELGQAGPPDLDELIQRLRMIHSEWEWIEEPDPYNLQTKVPLSSIDQPGIYNRAIVMLTERSPYTQGLEAELTRLQTIPEEVYQETALGAWLRGEQFKTVEPEESELIEVLPLNQEQRRAVLQGLTNPLTVITGPPGTGKSQVVTSLLINAAWKGMSVLFSSKNNKAVDVVEARVNALGDYPILIRHGSAEYQDRMEEYLSTLLSSATNREHERVYEKAKEIHNLMYQRFLAIENRINEIINLRNHVDHLEQQIELLRYELSPSAFKQIREIDLNGAEQKHRILVEKIKRANKEEVSFIERLFWPFIRKSRLNQLQTMAESCFKIARMLELKLPGQEVNSEEEKVRKYSEFSQEMTKRLKEARNIKAYFDALNKLSSSPPIEKLQTELVKAQKELEKISNTLWNSWLNQLPQRLSSSMADREALQKFNTLLGMVVGSTENDFRLDNKIRSQLMNLFPTLKKYLPCWAITSLSAHRRIPLKPAFFDLLIIDEASQCDIASVIPLLFRAKRVVVIGDPNQLRHISGLAKHQDLQLLSKHGLFESHINWGYSWNSLFDRVRSFCHSDDIVKLLEHHRSHADIIEFSNRQFYQSQLRIATRYSYLRFPYQKGPAVRWIDAPGNVIRPRDGSAYNQTEAMALLKELKRLVSQGYEGSIGIVTPFRAQADFIRDLISKQYPDLEQQLISKHEFEVNTVHRFQGDERDIIFFSPVVSSNCPDSSLRFLQKTGNLFNVAITRARACLIVVGDRQSVLQCGVDHLEEFTRYVKSLEVKSEEEPISLEDLGPTYPYVSNPEQVSDWEKILYEALYKEGLRPIPQYPVEKYRLDLAIIDGDRCLDIEVDGEQYHRDWNGELCQRDRLRNTRLQEYGWDVMRFWVYQVRDDLEGCTGKVKGWLAQRG